MKCVQFFLFKHDSDVLMRSNQSKNLGFPQIKLTVLFCTAHNLLSESQDSFMLKGVFKEYAMCYHYDAVQWGETHFEVLYLFLGICAFIIHS